MDLTEPGSVAVGSEDVPQLNIVQQHILKIKQNVKKPVKFLRQYFFLALRRRNAAAVGGSRPSPRRSLSCVGPTSPPRGPSPGAPADPGGRWEAASGHRSWSGSHPARLPERCCPGSGPRKLWCHPAGLSSPAWPGEVLGSFGFPWRWTPKQPQAHLPFLWEK